MNNSSHIPGSRHLDIGRMACTAAVIILCAMRTAVSGNAAERQQDGTESARRLERAIEEAAEGNALGTASFGVFAMTAAGDTLVDFNGEHVLVPASNLKMVTTGAALHFLGPEYRYETAIGYSGGVENGVLRGDLYIIGGGDPALGSRDSIAVPLEKTFRQWRGFLAKAGIRKIEGHVIGDGRFFDGAMEEDTWLWNDIGTYYGTGVSGLSFYENVKDFNVSAGAAPGDAVSVIPGYPQTPWMEYRHSCTTGEGGTGNRLYYYTSGFAPAGEMRGTFAVDRGPKTEKGSNKFPAYTCAWHFVRYLQECGVGCSSGAADTGPVFGVPGKKPADWKSLTIIGRTSSPTLRRIAFETNYESNNFFAETIFRTLGKELCGDGSYEGGRKAIKDVLDGLCGGSGGMVIMDGSGLSRQNLVSPAFFCRFLDAMLKSPAADAFLSTLPSPGDNGTLAYVMRGQSAELKSRILMKSGSMGGILCYSGYILPEAPDGEAVIFSVMANNCTATPGQIRAALEKVIIAIAEAGTEAEGGTEAEAGR